MDKNKQLKHRVDQLEDALKELLRVITQGTGSIPPASAKQILSALNS